MKIDEAIKSLTNIVEYWTCRPGEQEAARLAIEALREKQEREQEPKPLTLDELRERNGRPVYTKTIGVMGSGRWELLAFDSHWLYLKTAWEQYKMTLIELENSYGKTWLAYDRPPRRRERA